MEWSKIKNIVILILLLVNAFLLVMIFTQARSSVEYQNQALTDALAILERSGIHLEGSEVPNAFGAPMTVERDQNREAALATALLGPVEHQDLGSGRHRYQGSLGTAEFRSNGNFSFELEAGAHPVEAGSSERDHALACMELLEFEGELLSVEEDGYATVVCLEQLWQGVPVFFLYGGAHLP